MFVLPCFTGRIKKIKIHYLCNGYRVRDAHAVPLFCFFFEGNASTVQMAVALKSSCYLYTSSTSPSDVVGEALVSASKSTSASF